MLPYESYNKTSFLLDKAAVACIITNFFFRLPLNIYIYLIYLIIPFFYLRKCLQTYVSVSVNQEGKKMHILKLAGRSIYTEILKVQGQFTGKHRYLFFVRCFCQMWCIWKALKSIGWRSNL